MIICGIDEAGRGCLAGSLFVAGVACKEAVLKNGLNENLIKMGIKDSKKLSKKKRYALESRLETMSHLCHFVVEKTASEIDSKGLSVCLKEALEEIIKCVITQDFKNDLCAKKAQKTQLQNPQNPQNQQNSQNPQKNQNPQDFRFYFDGNSTFGASVANALRCINLAQTNDINATLECVIKGDEKIPLISCASIYAKCAKDTQSANLAKIYPQYDFATNAGYGTKAHINAILKHGISPIHRASFCVKFVDSGESRVCGDSRQFSYFAKSSDTKI
ncbi:ribonuclease HII [Helicobacter sp. T3_23-1059]